jgi:predicted transglutaminase-like cysteine proteinase
LFTIKNRDECQKYLGGYMRALNRLFFKCLVAGAMFVSTALPAQAEIFGKNEVKSSDIKQFSKWNEVVARHQQSLDPKLVQIAQWEEKVTKFKQLPSTLAKMEAVNKYINDKIVYTPDIKVWGKSDYWASIAETFTKGEGDCDDYAIAKYFTLREMGFKDEDMRIVVLKDKAINEIHAVLSVNVDGQFYILDNQFKDVKADYAITSYEPIYSINEQNWWRHV